MKPYFLVIVLLLSSTAFTAPIANKPEITPAIALKLLKDGNQRFQAGKPIHQKELQLRRGNLLKQQNPFAVILGCSDSRVPPEIIFDQTLGDLFIVRVAGNVLDSDITASIEYGVVNLGAKLIVVLGHESCGAVKTALTLAPGKSAGSPQLDQLIASIQNAIKKSKETTESLDEFIHKPVVRNIDFHADELVQTSALIKSRIAKGEVKIVRAIYDLKTGEVEFWSEK